MNVSLFRRLGLYFDAAGGNAGGAAGGGAGGAGAGDAGGGQGAGGAGGAGAGGAGGGQGGGAAGAAGGGSAGGAGGAAPEWTAGMAAEDVGYIQNKGWKGASDVLLSYRNLEKLHGVPPEQILKLPKDANDPAWNDVHKRLGRPDKPDGYTIAMPKEGGSKEFAEWAQKAFHGLNLSAKQGEGLSALWNEYVAGERQKMFDADQLKLKAEDEGLKKEWGAAYETRKELAKRACAKFGLDGDVLDALEKVVGKSKVMKHLALVGEATGEGSFVDGNGGGGGKPVPRTPAAAQAKLNELHSDKNWVDRFSKGGQAEINEQIELLKLIHPDEAAS